MQKIMEITKLNVYQFKLPNGTIIDHYKNKAHQPFPDINNIILHSFDKIVLFLE